MNPEIALWLAQDAVTNGAIYALLALAIIVVYTVTRVILVPQEAVYDQGYEDIPRRVPALERMYEVLGVRAEVALDDGLRRTIEWFKRQ